MKLRKIMNNKEMRIFNKSPFWISYQVDKSKDLKAFLGISAWQHSADNFSYSCDLLLLRTKNHPVLGSDRCFFLVLVLFVVLFGVFLNLIPMGFFLSL